MAVCALVWGKVSGCELAYALGQKTAPELGLPGPGGWTRLSEGEPLPGKGVRCEVVFGVMESWVGFGGLLRCQGWGPMLRTDCSGFCVFPL